jgi:hypothetical protein
VVYELELNEFKDHQEKAASSILAHLSRSQQTHVKDKGLDAKGIWDALKLVHVQQVPGMRFLAYNSTGHNRRCASDLDVDFDLIYRETADPDCLKINTCRVHPLVAARLCRA